MENTEASAIGRKNKIREIGLIFVIVALSLAAWFFLHLSIMNPGTRDWIIPGAFFSAVFVFWIVAVILIEKISHIAVIFFLSLAPSLFFVFDVWHFLILSTAFLFLLIASTRIERELMTSVKINLWRSIRFGRVMMVFALSLAIGSHYYFEIKDNNAYRNIPDFNLGNANEKFVSKTISLVYPGFDFSNDGELTVDEFILQSQKNAVSNMDEGNEIEKIIDEEFGISMTDQQKKEVIKDYQDRNEMVVQKNNELVLRESRKQISDLVGRQVGGDEKIMDVFSQMINKKIEDYLNFGAGNEIGGFSHLPIILAILLFLSILSLGSFLGPLWVLLAQIIFWLMVKLNWVKINKVMVEQEVIE